MNGGYFNQRATSFRSAIIAGKLSEGSFLFYRIRFDNSLNHKFRVCRQQQACRLPFHDRYGFAFDTAEVFIFRNIFWKGLRTDQHEQWIDTPSRRHLDRLSNLPGTGDVQTSVFAGGEVEADLFLALKHHAVSTDVQIAAVRVPRDNYIGRPSIATTIQRPMSWNRQLIQVNFFAGDAIGKEAGLSWRYFARRRAISKLVFDTADELESRCIGWFLKSERNPRYAWAEDIPQKASLKGTLLITLGRLKQDRRRGGLFGDEVTDHAHFLVTAHGLLYPDKVTHLFNTREPFTQVLDRSLACGLRYSRFSFSHRYNLQMVQGPEFEFLYSTAFG